MTDLVFLVLALVIVTIPFSISSIARVTGVVPLVVVQILTGIVLGPSVFGRLAPEQFHLLVNPAALARLSGAATIATLFFGFITGLHLEIDTIRQRGRGFAVIAAASVVVPTFAGFLGGLWIAHRHPLVLGASANTLEFAVAIAICVGVTALPVLGAILREIGLLGQRIGDLALGVAAINDSALWLLLGALMTAMAGRTPGEPGLLVTLTVLPIYLVAMQRVVRPLLGGAVATLRGEGTLSERGVILVCAVVMTSAAVTQAIGLHYIFGAFVAGTIMPRELRQAILDRFQTMTVGVLMPFFFTLTGMNTLIEPSSFVFVEIFLATTTLAVLGKVGGTATAALLMGESMPSALSLGALVQTKGLMEVVVLTIMLDRGVISGVVFSALTLMALVSTALATPLVRLCQGHEQRKTREDASASSLGLKLGSTTPAGP
jgi:Kef-type K+ transport system membrane component KefB